MGSSETMTTVALAIEGMHCKSCVLLIEETLDRDPAVHAVTEESTSVEAVCATIADLGYPATLAGDPDS